MKSFLLKFWPIILLLLIELILFYTNYKPGTYLMGWDNVMPEFDFKTNLIRNIFGVWQEHRGLGLYDGMSHIALTLHTMFLWFLSIFIPQNLLRYVFNTMMHFLGGLGMYLLIRYIYSSREAKNRIEKLTNDSSLPTKSGSNNKMISLIAAVFYLFNPATIQMFYTPLESFSVHFAALPWLALTLLNFLKSGNKKSYFWFILTTFLITPQYFVTTLFLSTLCLILPILIINWMGFFAPPCTSRCVAPLRMTSDAFKRSLIVLISFFLVNAFWLLPYIYGMPKNAPVIQSAKINLMSSNEIFLRNQVFGNIKNVLLLRGFTLDFSDLDIKGNNILLTTPWTNFYNSPLITIFSFILAIIALIGIVKIKKNQNLWPFLIMFTIGFVMLGTDTPILRDFIYFLRKNIPLFAEIFRFTFTKFSLLFAFSYTLFLVNGLIEIQKNIKKIPIYFISAVLIFILCIPAFKGNFFYQNLKIDLPNDYLNLFKYMQTLDPNKHVAILPEPEFWSWKYYQFGYRGSGFLWYGISQSLLDRAFDPWSNINEEYYWELATAIYQKKPEIFLKFIKKYNIDYFIIDGYRLSPNNQKSLYIDEIEKFLNSVSEIEHIGFLGKISLYRINNTEKNNFISIETNLPKIAPNSNWLEKDQAFIDFGNYINSDSEAQFFYPFRSLFTKRNSLNKNLDIYETNDFLTIKSPTIPSQFLNNFDSEIVTQNGKVIKNNNTKLEYILDKKSLISTNNATNILKPENVDNNCDILKKNTGLAFIESENQDPYLELSALNQRNCLSFDINDLSHRNSYLFKVVSRNITGQPLRLSFINSSAKHIEMENFLSIGDGWQTDYFILPPLAEDGTGYGFYAINNSVGRYNNINDIKQVDIYPVPYDFLKEIKLADTNNPQFNVSKSNSSILVNHPNPAEYAVNLTLMIDNLQLEQNNNLTLVLNQSYDDGWIAYQINKCQVSSIMCQVSQMFPYIFGQKITNHVMVNNWANAWILNERIASSKQAYSNTTNNYTLNANSLNAELITIYIFFWPQVLEFVGFSLGLIPFLWMWKKK